MTTLSYFQDPAVVRRSVFTRRGPITKPPLVIQSGVGVSLTPDTATLTGAVLTQDHAGKVIRITGSGNNNDGEFFVESVISPTKAKLRANFHTPEPNPLSWSLVDLRRGEIADTPSDVVVKINGFTVPAEEVSGLLGQVVLPYIPSGTDDVKVSYQWLKKPTVEMRGLNRRAFTLNRGRPPRRAVGSFSTYDYRAVLTNPKTYQASSLLGNIPQPLKRQLGYRAYERAYSVALNDPNLLVLNSPKHKIAYPQLQRILGESFIRYEGTKLPEQDILAVWERVGQGNASSSLGVLTVEDTSSGSFPTGHPLCWRRDIDLTFPHVFAMSWRMSIQATPTKDGVWTGLGAGYSDGEKLILLGYLEDGGTKRVGVLLGGQPAMGQGLMTSWRAVDLDWTQLRSYRLYRAKDGSVSFYKDGDVVPLLQVLAPELPYLYELGDPLNSLQGVYFGSLSRPAASTSEWDFVKYLVLPTNPYQTAPSVFVSYEGNTVPEDALHAWTPVGYHGTSTILPDSILLLDDTSASTASGVGLIEGDFRAYLRQEPLMGVSADVVLDVGLSLRAWTHSHDPYGVFASYSDGDRLAHLSFITDKAYSALSYPGRSFPEEAEPFPWSRFGGTIDPNQLSAVLLGRTLRITDSTISDGYLYAIEDPFPLADRVFDPATDCTVEARLRVVSYQVDADGYIGAQVEALDSTPLAPGRRFGFLLRDQGTPAISLHSQGFLSPPVAEFPFNWNDGEFHTYRLVKNVVGDTVSLFVDGLYVGNAPYSAFTVEAGQGFLSFGSASGASVGSLSTVDWAYVNAWQAPTSSPQYVGIWKGTSHGNLLDYHLPLKAEGNQALLAGNTVTDPSADFFGASVAIGDSLIIDEGPFKGVYPVLAVPTPTTLTLPVAVPATPIGYRIPSTLDWATQHKYRLYRYKDKVSLFLDSLPQPLLQLRYPDDLPKVFGTKEALTLNSLPGVVFGAMNPTGLSQSAWDFVRYGVTRSPSERRIVPHHMVLNQRNVMASPDHLFTNLPHTHTQFSSASTGIPPVTDPDFLASPTLQAFTTLFEGTPLVPSTQSKDVRGSQVVEQFVSVLNNPEDVLNSDADFTLNDPTKKVVVKVHPDVLYNVLKVVEKTEGEPDLLSPACDDFTGISDINYTKEVCLVYDGSVLPENDTTAATPWVLVSDDPGQVSTTAFSGVLTYSTGVLGTKTLYRNDTPYPDAPSLQQEVKFRLKVLNDSTSGTGDSQIRFGLSAPGFTVSFALVTTLLGERLVLLKDANNGNLLSSVPFDYLDGNFHLYRVVRDPNGGVVSMFIDS